jgi:hypothetical protein
MGSLVSRKRSTEVREMTFIALTFASCVRMSSWIPSTK